MIDGDPSLWQQISGWLWAVLVVPMKMLLTKVDSAASKEELAKAIRESEIAHGEFRTTMRTLFDNAERDRAKNSDNISRIQSTIHDNHVHLLEKLEKYRN